MKRLLCLLLATGFAASVAMADMMADSPVTFPERGALPSKYPPDQRSTERETPEEGYYIFGSPQRSLEQIEKIQSEMPKGEFTPPANGWTNLKRTHRILTEGGELRILAMGDSIVNDTMRSAWVAKLREAYPKADIRATVYVRGGGGCQHYRVEGRLAKNVIPRKPDLVFIGGISQKDIESIRVVVEELRKALPDVEILLATGAFGTADPRVPEELARAGHSGTGAYGASLKKLAEEEHCAYLDMTTPWAEYVCSSKLHPHRFYRDRVHANEYGEQILSKILMSFFNPSSAESADGSTSPVFAASRFRLTPVWAKQVDPRWRSGANVGNEDDGITAEFVEFSADGKRLVTANGLGEAFVLSAADGSVERTFTYITPEEIQKITEFNISGGKMKGMEVECGAFTSDGRFLVLGGNLNGVKVFDLRDGSIVCHFKDEGAEVDGLAVSPDGRFLAYAAPHACQLLRASDWSRVHRINHGSRGVVNSMDFTGDAERVVSAGNYGHVILTRTADGQQVGDGLILKTSSIKSVRFSPDARFIASGYGGAACVAVWQTEGMALVKQFPLFYIEAVAWSADGRYLLAGGRDNQGRLRVFNASDWQLVADPRVQVDHSNIEYIDVHGKQIAIAGEDGHVRLFKVETPD